MSCVETRSEAETERLGERLGRELRPGALVLLDGPLGAGKTTFVRGVARALGIDPADVASPTFALLHEYGDDGRGGPLLRHLDLYRVSDLESIRDVGLAEILEEKVPVLVEWPTPELFVRFGAIVVVFRRGEGDLRRIETGLPRGEK